MSNIFLYIFFRPKKTYRWNHTFLTNPYLKHLKQQFVNKANKIAIAFAGTTAESPTQIPKITAYNSQKTIE